MSGQIKFEKANPEYEEYLTQMQTLAKIQYNTQNKLNLNDNFKNKVSIKEIMKSKENFIEDFILNKYKYKDEITYWYDLYKHRLANLEQEEFSKVMMIDSKWFIDIMKQMHNLIKIKNYYFRPKINKDFIFQENALKLQKNQSSNLENYFHKRENQENKYKYDSENDNPGNNLISFLRIFDLYEKNDSITIDKEFCNYLTVMKFFNYFSNEKIFSALCR